ncbi:Pentatricopeptide repeat-containing protein, mitochondrial [Vitis vinifera]|uniref:Pentatricopeptide repeat-containing protein, mitochondrial n=1 Tax=Vitis vinifera TaxID=29760 RepID=A0A438JCG7_VITVI|nr:Pentatricopeptide repeat-containing protein, mitochondrial [Vitis vinifera]
MLVVSQMRLHRRGEPTRLTYQESLPGNGAIDEQIGSRSTTSIVELTKPTGPDTSLDAATSTVSDISVLFLCRFEETTHERESECKVITLAMLSLISPRHRNSFRCIQTLLYPFTQSFSTKPFKPIEPEPLSNPIISPNSTSFDHSTVRQTLSCYANDWKRALEFFDWVQTQCGFNHTTDTYNGMIDILGKFFEFDLIWVLIQRMKADPVAYPNHVTFRFVFKRYAAAHLVEEAMNAYYRTEEFNLRDETSYSNLIDALCEYKHVIEAEELFLKESKDLVFNDDVKIYNIILRGWFKMGWWKKCREFWEEMDRRGVCKSLYSYSIYMDIQCKSGKPWRAVKLYKEMKKKGIRLDVVAYNTVIRAIGLSEGVDFSIRVFREMKEVGCEPNVVTYNTIIKLLCENGRIREAYGVFDQMREKGYAPNVITYHCFFGCIEKPKQILRTFDRMINSGVRPRMDTYVMLMKKFGRWGFLRPVFIVWKKMEEQGCSPDACAYNALIDALVQKGMVDLARKYEEEMLAKGLSAKPRVDLGTKPILNDLLMGVSSS